MLHAYTSTRTDEYTIRVVMSHGNIIDCYLGDCMDVQLCKHYSVHMFYSS